MGGRHPPTLIFMAVLARPENPNQTLMGIPWLFYRSCVLPPSLGSTRNPRPPWGGPGPGLHPQPNQAFSRALRLLRGVLQVPTVPRASWRKAVAMGDWKHPRKSLLPPVFSRKKKKKDKKKNKEKKQQKPRLREGMYFHENRSKQQDVLF